jgi:hypothetical protein
MVPVLITTHVILYALFQRYKTARISYLRSFGLAMAKRRRPLQPLGEQTKRRAPELDTCTYVEVTTGFDRKRVFLRLVFLLNYDKSKCVSVGLYHAQNYHPLVEFRGTKLLPLVHAAGYVTILAERLPSLVETMGQNEKFQ